MKLEIRDNEASPVAVGAPRPPASPPAFVLMKADMDVSFSPLTPRREAVVISHSSAITGGIW